MARKALAEGVLQLREFRFQHIAVGLPQYDRAVGVEGAVAHVVDDPGRGQHIGAVGELHGARGGRHVRPAVIKELVGHPVDACALRDGFIDGRHEFRGILHARLGGGREQGKAGSGHQAENADMHPSSAPPSKASSVRCHHAPDAKFHRVLTAFTGAVKT